MGEGEKPALGGGVGKVVGGWVEGGGWMGHISRRTVTHNTDRDRTQDRVLEMKPKRLSRQCFLQLYKKKIAEM